MKAYTDDDTYNIRCKDCEVVLVKVDGGQKCPKCGLELWWMR